MNKDDGGSEPKFRDVDTTRDRIKRYVRVGRTAGGLAAKLAGNRLVGRKLDKGRHASDLQAALGGLKGPLMKVAQIMSTIPDMLPEEYMNELAQLQTNAPSMGWSFVRRRMRTEQRAIALSFMREICKYSCAAKQDFTFMLGEALCC